MMDLEDQIKLLRLALWKCQINAFSMIQGDTWRINDVACLIHETAKKALNETNPSDGCVKCGSDNFELILTPVGSGDKCKYCGNVTGY